jgi:hypothetical protein
VENEIEIVVKQVQNIIEMMIEIPVVMIIVEMIKIVEEIVQIIKDVEIVPMIDVIEEMIDVEMIEIIIEEDEKISEIVVMMLKIQIINGVKMKLKMIQINHQQKKRNQILDYLVHLLKKKIHSKELKLNILNLKKPKFQNDVGVYINLKEINHYQFFTFIDKVHI